jgi:tetratricopeptide (TPR) repeat protein
MNATDGSGAVTPAEGRPAEAPHATQAQAPNAAAPAPHSAAPRAELPLRDPDLVIARIHVRLGSLGLARAELETLAGRDRLDDEGIRDLAETRWRTGDVSGAGEAAAAYLETNPDDVLALVIAAEAQADLGRPSEARRLAGRALDRAAGSLDAVFAGMPRSQIWPDDAGVEAMPAGVLFDDLHPGPLSTASLDGPSSRAWGIDFDRDEPPEAGWSPPVAAGPSLWGDEPSIAGDVPDATALFHAGRVALDGGRVEDAATALILALRAAPGLAPAVLDLLGGRGETLLALVRGDAHRIVGREAEALRDHEAAALGAMIAEGAIAERRHGRPARRDPETEAEPQAQAVTDDQPTQEDS